MTDKSDPFTNMFEAPAQLAQTMFAPLGGDAPLSPQDAQRWAEVGAKLQGMWMEYQAEQLANPQALAPYFDPQRWMNMAGDWFKQMPIAQAEQQKALWEEGMELWQTVLGQYGLGPKAADQDGEPELPRKDRRFADERWRAHPAYALIYQTYLFLAERVSEMVDKAEGLNPQQRKQLRFTTRAITEAASPSNFPLLNPVVLQRTLDTRGENLIKGMQHLLNDMRRGQLSHTDASAFTLGENIATTPGKVVHETPLFQLI